MASDALKILAGVGAGGAGTSLVWVGATSTTAPANATAALTGFHDLGYTAATGVTISDSITSTPVQAFGTNIPVRVIPTGESLTYKFNILESSSYAIETFYRKAVGSITPSSGAFTVDRTANAARQLYSFVFDAVDGTNHLRVYLPSCEVTDVDDQTIAAGAPITYGITLTAYPVLISGSQVVQRTFYVVADDVS